MGQEKVGSTVVELSVQAASSAAESWCLQSEGDLAVGEPGSAAAQVPDGHRRGDRRESSYLLPSATDCLSDRQHGYVVMSLSPDGVGEGVMFLGCPSTAFVCSFVRSTSKLWKST